MKITRTGTPSSTPVRRAGASKGAAAKNFGEHISIGETAESRGVGGAKGVSGVDSLLAIQEVDNPADLPTKARQWAENILDHLDEVRHGLLMGGFSRRQLEKLAESVRTGRLNVDDPKLAEILDQVELRAEIELAKYSTLD